MSSLTFALDQISDPRTGKVLFARHELACKGSNQVRLDARFADALAILRLTFNKPMTVNSCCRTWHHNQKEGGSPGSFHVCDMPSRDGQGGAMAIDIGSRDAAYNAQLVGLALSLNWSVGVAQWGIHLDYRTALGMPQVVFGYGG